MNRERSISGMVVNTCAALSASLPVFAIGELITNHRNLLVPTTAVGGATLVAMFVSIGVNCAAQASRESRGMAGLNNKNVSQRLIRRG